MIEQVWQEYKESGSSQHREQIILHYYPLVEYAARRMQARLPNTVEYDDLVSFGIFGLIDAIDKFDLNRQIKFETYAMTRINGAILDELRAMDWLPRSLRSQVKLIERAYSELEMDLRRSPTTEELADYLDMSAIEVDRLLARTGSGNFLLSLDENINGQEENLTLVDTLASDENQEYLLEDLREYLIGNLVQLSDREQVVMVLYYYEGLTLADIGRILGVTESRVCQIHTKAINSLVI